MAIINPSTISLQQILSGKKYEVPMYQRPFSWTIDEAYQLWTDLEKNNAPYFLGILVFQRTEDSKKFQVVDGQQRLATLLLLLRAAVEILRPEDKRGSEKLQEDYINQKLWGREKSEFTLTLNERDKFRFFTLVDDTEYLPDQLSPEERKKIGARRMYASLTRLDKVKDFFLNKLKELKTKEGNKGIVAFIRDKVLNLSFIEVKLEDDNDIFLFFETMNARGVDLTIADLLKNRVCSASSHPLSAAHTIDEISNMLSEGKINTFLLHYCLARADSLETKKTLMSWYTRIIEQEKDDFLTSLREYADNYSLFLEPRKNVNTEQRNVLTYLKALGATRCYPLLLVGYKFLPRKEFVRLCKAIESLTFRHSTITGKDAKVLEDIYHELSKDIRNKESLDKILRKLNDQSKKISDELFETAFKSYAAANHQIAKYILLKLDNFLNKEAIGIDWNDLTLEHILAGGADWDGKEEFLERLGNLTLLKGKLNVKVGNKSFKFKKGEYKKETRIKLTQKLSEYNDFTKETINKRQESLAKLACKVWKVY